MGAVVIATLASLLEETISKVIVSGVSHGSGNGKAGKGGDDC